MVKCIQKFSSTINRLSLRHKLVIMMVLITGLALVVFGTAMMVWQWNYLRGNLVSVLSSQAKIIANNSKAAITFQDRSDADDILSALSAEPSILAGCLYNDQDDLFAYYLKDDITVAFQFRKIQDKKFLFLNNYLIAREPIVLENNSFGTVYLQASLSGLHAALKQKFITMVVVMALTVLMIWLLSVKIQKIISDPILKLTETAKHVSQKKDYSVRARNDSKDEIGTLVESFNEMLCQIQNRDAILVQSNLELERRVGQRTASLSEANDKLKHEINIRKQSEQKQQQLLDELKGVNQELNEFAYIASHDLKAPLRAIRSLAKWILEDYAHRLDEEGQKQLELLNQRTERMQKLIDGILQYSRVGRCKEELVTVDLNKMVPEIIDMIAPPDNITVSIETDLPTIECEETRMMQVFQNLISNAVKYMDKPDGRISISCREQDEAWEFAVTDNGPGIDKKYHDKIFQIFQTLTDQSNYESTGIGLTVVKKIVEMCGGQITLESELAKGTTFYFTYPKKKVGINNVTVKNNIAG